VACVLLCSVGARGRILCFRSFMLGPLFRLIPASSAFVVNKIAVTRSIVYWWTVYHMLSKLSNESMFSFLHCNITQFSACTSALSINDENSSIYVRVCLASSYICVQNTENCHQLHCSALMSTVKRVRTSRQVL